MLYTPQQPEKQFLEKGIGKDNTKKQPAITDKKRFNRLLV